MKSTLRIEFDYDNNEPFIEIKSDNSSDDMRDKMLRYFLQSCQQSTELKLLYTKNGNLHEGDHVNTVRIFPSNTIAFEKMRNEIFPQKAEYVQTGSVAHPATQTINPNKLKSRSAK